MCYISMNREDGLAAAEVVHEAQPEDSLRMFSQVCPRCEGLYVEIEAAQDAHEEWISSPNLADVE